ncbi:hypothetical protein Tco_1308893 [Tanacetum coccineum]
MGRDTIQLENAVSTISQEYLLEFTFEYGITEGLHPELPGPEETIVEFSEGKDGVYTKFFEFANFRIPISQFLFDILGHYQIHLSQLSVIGAAKQTTREKHPTVLYKTPGLLEELEQSIFLGGRENISHRRRLAHKRSEGWDASSELIFRGGRDNIEHTPYPYPKTTRSPIMPSRAEPEILSGGRHMDLFNLISALNPTKVKTGTRPRVAHEVPLLTVTASRVIEMEDAAMTSESSGTPSTIEKSPLDFANEDPPQTITERGGTEDRVQDEVAYEIPPTGNASTKGVALEIGLEEEVAAMRPLMNKGRRKRGNTKAEANAPPKVLRRDHDTFALHRCERSRTVVLCETITGPRARHGPEAATEIPIEKVSTTEINIQFSVGSLESGRSTSVPSVVGSPGDFLSQYNINLARQVAMGSQLRLRFEQEVRLLKEVRSKIARRD